MTGLVDWASERARMIIALIIVSLTAGIFSYTGLPKEGEPDIEIPALFISVPFPGISAGDSETLLVRPMETELGDIDGLKKMTATASENYAGVALEFEFGWDKTKTMADVRDAMNAAEANFPSGAEKYSINEINFSEFPIIIVNLTGCRKRSKAWMRFWKPRFQANAMKWSRSQSTPCALKAITSPQAN